jgi:hypothetical protein
MNLTEIPICPEDQVYKCFPLNHSTCTVLSIPSSCSPLKKIDKKQNTCYPCSDTGQCWLVPVLERLALLEARAEKGN